MNNSGREDGVTVTTTEASLKKKERKKKKSPGSNQFMASLQPFTLVSVSQKNKIVCEDGQTWT